MLDWIVDTISSLGYIGIIGLMFLENVFPPIPSELIMPLAGFAVSQGKMNLALVILAGVVGSLLGGLPWYYAGKTLGEERLKALANKYGKWLAISSDDIDKAKQWFKKYGAFTVFFGRLVPGIRTLISVPAGMNEMDLIPFLLYSMLGTVIWVGFLTSTGYILGEEYHLVDEYLGPVSSVVLVAVIVGFVIWFIKQKRKSS